MTAMTTLTTAQAETVLGALADAAAYRRRKAEEPCSPCDEARGSGYCAVHRASLETAQGYDDLAVLLGGGPR